MNIVLSGINLFSGGTLKIYRDVLQDIVEAGIDKKNEIIAFVYRCELFSDIAGNIQFIEVPNAKKSYLHRLYYEYVYFCKWSRKRRIDVWIAMHDLSPGVFAKYRYTYFQSAQIFYHMPAGKIKYEPICFVLSKFYKYLIRINCRKIDAFVVQAEWIRSKMNQMFCPKNVIVHNPAVSFTFHVPERPPAQHIAMRFIYPAFPRVFKNFEIICEASGLLQKKGIHNYEILFTISGNENRYAQWLYLKYKKDKRLKWIGQQDYKRLLEIYQTVDALIFASELETWGLPITELGSLGKSLILADEQYAHESSKNYSQVSFFRNSGELAVVMAKKIAAFGTEKYDLQENEESVLRPETISLAEHIFQLIEEK